jgi:hypothetical protein
MDIKTMKGCMTSVSIIPLPWQKMGYYTQGDAFESRE